MGSINILTILILSVQQHETSFNLFVSFAISFINVLQFSVYRSFTSLVKYVPKYFILFFEAIINGIFFNVYYFWERHRAWAGEGQRERETQNPIQDPGSELSVQSPTRGSKSWAMSEIMTRAKVSHPTDWATQAPQTSSTSYKSFIMHNTAHWV